MPFDVKMIDISELHGAKDNFFSMNDIEEFADAILGQGGIKNNLVVRPLISGGYEIVSGHRRKAAIQFLIDRGDDVSHFLSCVVQEYEDDETDLLNFMLNKPFEMAMVYEGTLLQDAHNSLPIIESTINVLANNSIAIPEISKIAFSDFSERNGWGYDFDGSYLSIILNNPKKPTA